MHPVFLTFCDNTKTNIGSLASPRSAPGVRVSDKYVQISFSFVANMAAIFTTERPAHRSSVHIFTDTVAMERVPRSVHICGRVRSKLGGNSTGTSIINCRVSARGKY